MTYTKPEVEILGNATAVIELVHSNKMSGAPEIQGTTAPAYDLDE